MVCSLWFNEIENVFFSRKVLITLKKKKDYVSIPRGIYSLVTIILGGKH